MEMPLPSEAATRRLGQRIAAALRPGDLLLLHGDLGAGKTFLARAVIQTLAGAAIDVPSPTFVLAAPYDLPDFPVVHFDLYRLNDPSEADELGLEDALEDGAAIVEWPEILGPDRAANAIRIRLSERDGRHAGIDGPAAFMERLDAV